MCVPTVQPIHFVVEELNVSFAEGEMSRYGGDRRSPRLNHVGDAFDLPVFGKQKFVGQFVCIYAYINSGHMSPIAIGPT